MRRSLIAALLATGLAPATQAAAPPPASPSAPAVRQWDEAAWLSWFGERPAFSPDGKRVAFVGKLFGDAYEIDIATRKVRNLTGHLPHQGVIRVQYLPNGDYLITAPRVLLGPATRFNGAALWVLDRNLEHGLIPLEQLVMEGVAISARTNKIAFTELPGTDPGTEFYTADIVYRAGVPSLANKQRVARETGCMGETQDFRNVDRELTYTCYGKREEGRGSQAGVYGVEIASGKVTRYRDNDNEYNEVEGISPDGSWTTVECAGRVAKGLAPLDICRLELVPNGGYRVLFKGTQPNSTRKANNPVISPDGKWMALSSADAAQSANPAEAGKGDGILLLRLAD
jgi:Tol biopolymer transport system component